MAQATRCVKLILLAAVASRCLLRIAPVLLERAHRDGAHRGGRGDGEAGLHVLDDAHGAAADGLGDVAGQDRGHDQGLALVAREGGRRLLRATSVAGRRLADRPPRLGARAAGRGRCRPRSRPARSGGERVRVSVPAARPRGAGRSTPASSRPRTAGCCGTAPAGRGRTRSSPRNPSPGRRRVDPPASAAWKASLVPAPRGVQGRGGRDFPALRRLLRVVSSGRSRSVFGVRGGLRLARTHDASIVDVENIGDKNYARHHAGRADAPGFGVSVRYSGRSTSVHRGRSSPSAAPTNRSSNSLS